jgi:hypothetical protein
MALVNRPQRHYVTRNQFAEVFGNQSAAAGASGNPWESTAASGGSSASEATDANNDEPDGVSSLPG